MASGESPSTGRLGSGAGTFDFGSDDVLCSYDDLASQNNAKGSRSDSAGKEIGERRIGRPPANVYSQREGYNKQEIIFLVEKCMKKYTDSLLSSIEGINGRLSQLEDYCYNLERSMGDLRSDLSRDQNESDSKFKALEKHLLEVHRSVQIMRDKQELADTQKELTKLHLSQNDSSDLSENKMHDDSSDAANQQLALVVHQQAAQVPQQARSPDHNQSYKELPVQQSIPSTLSIQQSPQTLSQGGSFLPLQNQLPSQPLQHQQTTAVQQESRYAPQRLQIQDLSGQQGPVFSQSQTSTFPQYQQQWSQPASQQLPPHAIQPQAQFQIQGAVHPSYPPHQPTKVTTEAYPGSAPIRGTYAVIPQSTGTHQEVVRFGYGGQGSSTMQLPPTPQPTSQSLMGPPQLQSGGYVGAASFPPQSSTNGHMMYGNSGVRTGYPGSYPAAGHQNQQATFRHPGEQSMRGHSHGELLEKALGMGFSREQVANAIYRMEENRQPIDFNTLLDALNSRPSGPAGGGW